MSKTLPFDVYPFTLATSLPAGAESTFYANKFSDAFKMTFHARLLSSRSLTLLSSVLFHSFSRFIFHIYIFSGWRFVSNRNNNVNNKMIQSRNKTECKLMMRKFCFTFSYLQRQDDDDNERERRPRGTEWSSGRRVHVRSHTRTHTHTHTSIRTQSLILPWFVVSKHSHLMIYTHATKLHSRRTNYVMKLFETMGLMTSSVSAVSYQINVYTYITLHAQIYTLCRISHGMHWTSL